MKSTHNIHRPGTVNVENFEFGEVQVNKYGGKTSKVKYDGQEFYMQLPRMRLPYGLSKYEEKDGNGNTVKVKYSMDFSLGGYEEGEDGKPINPRVREFYDLLKQMEKKLHSSASNNSVEWLGIDEANVNVAKALCREEVRYAKDKVTKKTTNKYPPTFKSKVGFWDGRWTCNAFDSEKQAITDLEASCPGGTEVVAICKLREITFAGGKCGYSWLVHQVKVYPATRMPSYAFIEDEDDETPVKRSPSEEESEEKSVEKPTSSMVEDSEEEEEDELDEEEEEEEEEPPPVPKKKVITKRVVKKKS